MIGGFNALFDGRPNRGCGDHQRQTESHLTSYSPKCVFARAHKVTSSMHDYHFPDHTDWFIANVCRKT